jgi:GT2 family glycosyltransferase
VLNGFAPVVHMPSLGLPFCPMPEFSVVELSAASPLRRSLVQALVRALRDAGAEVAVHLDRLPERFGTGLVLDPQDGLEAIASTGEISRFLQRSVVVSTATDPDSKVGDRPFLEVAAGAALTSPLLASRLAFGTARVARVGIGFDPSFLGEAVGDRPNDVAILLPDVGGRSRLVAGLAGVLADRPHEIRMDYARSLIGRSSTDLEVGARRDLLARTRVVVYLPDNPDCPCLEWLHLHDVFANACAVVTSRTMDIEPLVAGEHTVAAGPLSLRLLVESLLDDPAWERRVGLGGREVVERELPLSGCAATLIGLANGLPAPRGRRLAPVAHLAHRQSSDAQVAAVVTWLALEHAALRRARMDGASAAVLREAETALLGDPEVSVVIPVRNYGEFVEDAIASACDSSATQVEVVVVDDASTDDSADRVEALIERGEAPLRLLRLAVQGGLGAARNHGFRLARAPLVFPLDADDLLYPSGLARLRDALGADPGAAFAYGVVERFDESGPIDFVSTQGFERELFAFGNYITAMALIRRSAWERVGGYEEEGILQLGWEDYDFWLKLVDAGERGTWVPSLIARYRRHGASMVRLTDIVAPELELHIRREHPSVFEAAST